MFKLGKAEKNYVFNLIYEVFSLIVPFAVTPYISRVLGESGTGQYSYVYSIVTYFTLFGGLGFNKYGQRLIAQHQGDKHQQTVDYWEIFFARMITVLTACILYIILAATKVYGTKYSALVYIFTINVIAVGFDCSFFFKGNEDFGKIVFRNIVVKLMGFTSIFVFVKSASDLWIYALIQSLIVLISNISLWLYFPKYIVKIRFKDINPYRHFFFSIFAFFAKYSYIYIYFYR